MRWLHEITFYVYRSVIKKRVIHISVKISSVACFPRGDAGV